jgi:hypothetical protein
MAAYRGKTKARNIDQTNPFQDDLEDDFEHVNKDQIQRQIRETQQRSLDSTKRSIALIEDSHDVAIKTAEDLQYQGEQLDRIERNLDNIHEDMSVANRNISSMKSVWNSMANYFKKPVKQTARNTQPVAEHVVAGDMFASSSLQYSSREREPASGPRTYQTSQIQSSVSTSQDPFERELNEDIQQISRGLGRLKEDALILGNELNRQNEQLPRITTKTEVADIKVTKAHKEVRKLL